MARRSSGGRSARSPPPRRSAARSPPPQTAHQAPPPAVAQSSGGGSMLGGIGSTIVQGMGFGAGSAVAHRAVDAVMGPRTIQHETVVAEAAGIPAPTANSLSADGCNVHSKAFQDVLKMGSFRKKTRRTKGSDSELEDSDGFQNEDLMTKDQDSDYEDAEEEENIDGTDQDVDDDENESDEDEDESKETGSSEEEEEGIAEIGLLKSNGHKDDELEDLEKEYKELRNQELNLLKNLKRNKEDDILKGQAVKNQKAIWDRSLELRILLQKPFSNSNRLPQEPIRSTFCNLDEGVKEAYNDLVVSSKKTLESLVELEEALLEKNPSISQSSSGNVGKSLKKHSNESTHLNDEDEEEWSRVSQMHTRIAPFRNKSIDKWQRKTQVTTGAAAIRNKLHAFNQNISEQVAAYMRDPSRMVKQMQLRRSTAGVFGDISDQASSVNSEVTHPDGDPELLDDSEFYQQLLKEFLEKVDPNSSETAFYAVKRLQTKKRKIVDRRASKSRKIRYSVHEHIVNFMAPRPMDLPPMAPKLFENLFGVKTQKC